MNNMNQRQGSGTEATLLSEIRALSFACLETAMYLNAYPDNRTALRYFDECRDRLGELTETYEERYGPLTQKSAGKNGSWDWGDTPWPWQKKED